MLDEFLCSDDGAFHDNELDDGSDEETAMNESDWCDGRIKIMTNCSFEFKKLQIKRRE